MSMMNKERMKRLFVKNLLTAICVTLFSLTCISIVAAVVMLSLVPCGEYAILHVYAMAGIAGAFGVMAALACAMRDSVNI